MARTTWVLGLVLSAGCSGPGARDAGPPPLDAPADVRTLDAPSTDAPSRDASPDARSLDAPLDARTDAFEAIDARLDVPRDTPLDGGLRDAPAADAGVSSVIQCAPAVPAGASSGLACSAAFWPGFQFEITADRHLLGVGVQGAVDGAMPASVHVTLFRISGPGATPMLADPGSVVVRQLITLPSGTPMIGTSSADAILTPGWYALVVGTGAHGATATGATLPSNGSAGCTSTPGSGFPFSVRLMDGMYILQGASPHLFVALE